MRTVLNPSAPIADQKVLTLGKAGQPLVEPMRQPRGAYVAITPDVILHDRWNRYPADVKAALKKELGQ